MIDLLFNIFLLALALGLGAFIVSFFDEYNQ